MITFRLNGETVRVAGEPPTRTLLDWLREERGLTGTKEGCNEGDCGACTVMVTDARGRRALNACILFLDQIDGAALRTVEGLAGPDDTPHPMQAALVDHHGSQCGFCTPGFAVSMATAHANGAVDWNDQLAGNLCRCTGYAPIVRAAEAAAGAPIPDWIAADAAGHAAPRATPDTPGAGAAPARGTPADAAASAGAPAGPSAARRSAAASGPPDAAAPFRPRSADELAAWYAAHPDATLIAGATDVGLWVTKQHRDLGPVAFLAGCDDLRGIEITDQEIRVGAMATLSDLLPVMADHHPAFAELIRRYGSVQVRNAATVGGNIANGSPIGDSPPPLIALGATLHLRHGNVRRALPLEEFFLDYGVQDRHPGEFVEAVTIPRQPDGLHVHKISKRFDQDISALCGAFAIRVEDGRVASARIAFGGMAGIPKRARTAETALVGHPWTESTVAAARAAFAKDFTPLSDMRASADYRLEVAGNLLARVFHATAGRRVSVLEVRP